MNRPDQPAQPVHPNSQTIADQPLVIPVIEEQLIVDKRVIEKGSVRVSKRVREVDETVNIPLVEENVSVERIPINQYVAEPPPPVRYEGNVMIIPVLREVLVVEKRLVLVEELRVTKQQIQTQETQKMRLRKEEVEVKRVSRKKYIKPQFSPSFPGASGAFARQPAQISRERLEKRNGTNSNRNF